MKRTTVAAALLTAAAITASAAPAAANPLSDLFGSAGSSGFGSSDGGSSGGSSEGGSSGFGSSDDGPPHYGKLGRADAPNGVKSINVWVYAPDKTPEIVPGTYPRSSRLGVRWNSTIDAGPVVDGDECDIEVRLTGPKVPKEAEVFATKDCTSVKSYFFRGGGDFDIRVTDKISGASNAITFTVE